MLILNPAQNVITLCGGDAAVAKLSGRDVSRVRRWSWPREKGGSDGIIPVDVMLQLLSVAPSHGIRGLTAEHFTLGANKIAREDLRVLSMLMDGMSAEAIATELGASVSSVESAEARLRENTTVSDAVWARVERRRAKCDRRAPA